MSRRDEFDDGHARARNHADVTYGEMVDPHRVRKGAKNEGQHRLDMQYLLALQSREGGYKLPTNPALHISWDEHKRRERHRWLEENG